MTHLTLGQRLDRVLLHLQFAAQGPAISYDREVVTSSPEKATEPPTPDMEYVDLRRRARQLVQAYESYVRYGEGLALDVRESDLRPILRVYAGRRPEEVAHAESCAPGLVRRARANIGQDPETGLPKPRALTSREVPA